MWYIRNQAHSLHQVSCDYIAMDVLKRGAAAGPVSRIAAGDVERAVVDQLRAILRAPGNHRSNVADGVAQDRHDHRGQGARRAGAVGPALGRALPG
jgi:hypothetical protein